jgi:hypothetical protein
MGLLLVARHQESEADTVLFDNLTAYDVDQLLQGQHESGVKPLK